MLILSASEPLRGVPYLVGRHGIAPRTEQKVGRAGRPLIWLPPRELTRHERDIQRRIRGEERRCSPVTIAGLGVRVYPGGAPVYSPLDEVGEIAWFDMLDPTSFTQAGTVTSITNKVSSVAWTEATNPPDYNATGLNSLPAMSFNGSSHRIISTEAAVFGALADSPAYSMYYVASFDVADSDCAVFGVGNSGGATASRKRWGTSSATTGFWIAASQDASNNVVNAVSDGGSSTGAHRFAWWASGTTTSLEVDAVADADNPIVQVCGTVTSNRSSLGSRPDSSPGEFHDGMLGELLLFSAEHDASARGRIDDYLVDRWGF